VAIEELSQTEARPMDTAFQAEIEAAAERHAPAGHLRMPSGAGHDAQVISHKLRAGMMFIPSLKGISHHWSEDTKEEDIVLGAQVFADAAAAILKAG
jgi:N-carbamoyl-L-amino-acid hydrolase